MDISRIQSQAFISAPMGGVNRPESASIVKKDVADFRAEIAPDYRFKPSTAPVVNSLITDAINDSNEQMRTNIVVAINQRVTLTQLQEQAKFIRMNFRPSTGSPDELMEAFKREARRFSKGSSAYELALIDAIATIDSTEGLNHFTEQFLYYYLRTHQQELQAFLNIQKALDAHQGQAPVEELAGIYEHIFVHSQSLLQALKGITEKLGVKDLATWLPFLRQSATLDLISLSWGADKNQLMHVLQELKSFKILNTFVAMLEEIEAKRFKGKKVDNYLLSSFEYIEQPLVMLPSIEKWVSACMTEEQILFFQSYRQVFKQLPEEAFKDNEQQRNALTILQNKTDELIYNEE
jgi:type III secretion system TyeA family effector delivery regulator